MSVLTGLRVRSRGRIDLEIDGVPFCTVSESLVASRRLYVGRELDEGELHEVYAAATAEAALRDAYAFLERRARSRGEVEARLRSKGHDEPAVSDAVQRLVEQGLLDDADFARRYVADKRELGGWGALRVRRGLQALGVDDEAIDGAMHTVGDTEDERRRALRLLHQGGTPRPPLEAARRRAYQTLLRRGFAAEVAYWAVRAWSSEAPSEAGSESTEVE